jgi:hypothetical protein
VDLPALGAGGKKGDGPKKTIDKKNAVLSQYNFSPE